MVCTSFIVPNMRNFRLQQMTIDKVMRSLQFNLFDNSSWASNWGSALIEAAVDIWGSGFDF